MVPTPTDLRLGPWRAVAEGVHVLVAEPSAVTIGLVVGATGCLVVDTGSTPEQGRAIRSAVEQVTAVPLVGVAVTHWHHDHFHGLAGFAGIESYGHETLVDRLGPVPGRPEGLVGPTRSLALAAGVDLGGVRVEIAHLGRGHTEGDLVVSVALQPAQGHGRPPHVVFAGDLIETAGPPWFGSDSWPLEWAATLDGVIGLLGPQTLLVPGHGDPVTRDVVFGQRGAIGAVAGELQRLVQTGVAVDQAGERGDWPFPVEHIADAIVPGYAELARQGVRPARPSLPIVQLDQP
jgi:glyoxylase-like metal-dependent hydrolase (beta-lactamase superfamily II)